MKNIFVILSLFIFSSCSSQKDDPLIVPPNFNELPDANKPEENIKKQEDKDLEKLKELLLKNE